MLSLDTIAHTTQISSWIGKAVDLRAEVLTQSQALRAVGNSIGSTVKPARLGEIAQRWDRLAKTALEGYSDLEIPGKLAAGFGALYERFWIARAEFEVIQKGLGQPVSLSPEVLVLYQQRLFERSIRLNALLPDDLIEGLTAARSRIQTEWLLFYGLCAFLAASPFVVAAVVLR